MQVDVRLLRIELEVNLHFTSFCKQEMTALMIFDGEMTEWNAHSLGHPKLSSTDSKGVWIFLTIQFIEIAARRH